MREFAGPNTGRWLKKKNCFWRWDFISVNEEKNKKQNQKQQKTKQKKDFNVLHAYIVNSYPDPKEWPQMKTGALEIRVLIHLMAAMPSSMSPKMK